MSNFILRFFSKRYIAGDTISDAIERARELNTLNISALIDALGENVRTTEDAEKGVTEYLNLIDGIKAAQVSAEPSLKLTHLGLDLGTDIALINLLKILEKAKTAKNFLWIDMESSTYTQKTLDIYAKARAKYDNVGIAIQAYLKRSETDIDRLIGIGACVRLVKGAYKESPEIVFKDKKDVDANYLKLIKKLMSSGTFVAIATHDEKLIRESLLCARKHDLRSDLFEVEMLLGIKSSLQQRLANEGVSVRVYIPYGEEWLPYTLRRLTERKENLWFFIKNLI